jgi:predicted RNase H-like nuclease
VVGAAVDDVLDAAVVAWSGRRVLSGQADSLPDPPEVFSDGWPSAIWV